MDIIKQVADIIEEASKEQCCLFTEEGWHCGNEGTWRTFSERFGTWAGTRCCLCDSHWAFFMLMVENPRAADQLNNPRVPWEERLRKEHGEE